MTKDEIEVVENNLKKVAIGVRVKAVCYGFLDHKHQYAKIYWHSEHKNAFIGMPYAMWLKQNVEVLVNQIRFDLIKDGFEVLHE